MFWLGFGLGLGVGVMVVVLFCLCCAASRADQHAERILREERFQRRDEPPSRRFPS